MADHAKNRAVHNLKFTGFRRGTFPQLPWMHLWGGCG